MMTSHFLLFKIKKDLTDGLLRLLGEMQVSLSDRRSTEHTAGATQPPADRDGHGQTAQQQVSRYGLGYTQIRQTDSIIYSIRKW